MATSVNFGGKKVTLPGAYSTIVSGKQSSPISTDYGRCLIVDTGAFGGYGGGSGVNGEFAKGKDSIYTFKELSAFQNFIKGGMLYKAAEFLFSPDKRVGANGISELLYVRAATTTGALMTFTATGGGSNGGTFKVKTLDEGTWANGVLTSTHLDKGYAYTIETGVVNTTKWIFKIWRGSWTGLFTDGVAFNEISKATSKAILIDQSPEFNNISELLYWANNSSKFNRFFRLDATSAAVGTGAINAGDVSAVAGYQVASGATETFNSTDMDLALDALSDENYKAVLSDRYGISGYQNANLLKQISHNISEAKFKSFMFVGGGADLDSFDDSQTISAYYDSPYVHVVHGDFGESSNSLGLGYRRWPSIISAAAILGRTFGKQPQVPVTNKTIGVDKLIHSLSKIEMETALSKGILTIVYNNSLNRNVVLQGVNTLQDNERTITPSGASFQISTMRIAEQINTNLVIDAEKTLLSDENGVNRNTLSANVIKSFVESRLESYVATTAADNLILSYRNIVVVAVEDSWQVSYEFVVNGEVNKIFFTGFIF